MVPKNKKEILFLIEAQNYPQRKNEEKKKKNDINTHYRHNGPI